MEIYIYANGVYIYMEIFLFSFSFFYLPFFYKILLFTLSLHRYLMSMCQVKFWKTREHSK